MPSDLTGFRLSPQQRRAWRMAGWVQCALLIPDGADVAQLRRSFEEVAAQEIFDAGFQKVPGMKAPILVPGAGVPAAWREIEIEGETSVDRLFAMERAAGGPLLRALFAGNVLILSASSMCADVATMGMLASHIAGVAREAGIPYVQFAEWQNRLLDEDEYAPERDRWSEPAPVNSAAVSFAFELRPPLGDFAPRFGAISIPAGRLREASVLACWKILLRTPVAVTVPGRDYAELAGVIGPVARTVPLRVSYEPSEPFEDIERKIESALQECREWAAYYPDVDADFPFSFSWEVWPECVIGRYVCTERFGLHLVCALLGNRLKMELGYDASRFAANDVDYIARLFETLLVSALDGPHCAADELGLMDSASRQAMLAQSRGPVQPIAQQPLQQPFEEQAARTPDRVAVTDGRTQLTYCELDAAASAVAQALLRRGCVGLVGLLADRSVHAIAGLLGILKAGAAYVPLDSSQPQERLLALARDAGVCAFVAEKHLTAEAARAGVPVVEVPAVTEDSQIEATPNGLAYAIFTSGSTGKPKAVAIGHKSVVNLLGALESRIYADLGSPLRVALNAPLTFDASVKQWIQLLHGHTLCMVPEEVRYDPPAMLAWLEREKIEVLDCTPAQLKPLLAAGPVETALPNLKAVLVGGEAIDVAMWTSLAAHTRIRFHNVYGPTECTVDTTECRITNEFGHPVIGRPLPNIETLVLDPRLELVPVGASGELFLGGAGLAEGYLNAPALTAERFLPNPFAETPGARLYRTGDLVRWLGNGRIEYLGRLDRQIKMRGYRVDPSEIEAVLAEHPSVGDAAVASEDAGDGKRLVAYVALKPGNTPEESELRNWLRRALPEFMLPARFRLIDNVRLSRHGKVDYQALAAQSKPFRRASAATPPRNELESRIAEIWRQVLNLETVGVDENFFDLGGHSLLLTRLYARLREETGREFPMVELFRHPTVSALAAFLANGANSPFEREAIQDRVAKQRQAFRAARAKESQ
ncbi:MAG TPA: amino acid adenylation domain-containing protein [Bryobacteraceae bacterium]